MQTFRQFAAQLSTLPLTTSWYLSDLGEARGQQELFTRQTPQVLKVLREHAIVESAVSSNRIEGVEIAQTRIGTVIFGNSRLSDRNEEEVRGYREALQLIHEHGRELELNEELICRLHYLSRAGLGDAGHYKEHDSDIIEKYPDGRQRVRFATVPASETPVAMHELLDLWHRCLKEQWLPPLLAVAAFNLDFLCIHPFRDGNGRVSRLLFLLQCYQLGYEAGRYISLEKLIEENKERYYETLEISSIGWHEGKHDAWPLVNYLLYILKQAYKIFAERATLTTIPHGAKTRLIEQAIAALPNDFKMEDITRAVPVVSVDMVRKVLRDMRNAGLLEPLRRGRGAAWRKLS